MNAGLPRLSEREREVLRLLARGHDVKSVARELGLSSGAVGERLREARRKLGVSSSREAARLLAAEEGGYNLSVAAKSGVEAGAEREEDGAGRIAPRHAFAQPLPLAITGAAMLALIVSAAAFWTASGSSEAAPVAAPKVVSTSPRNGSIVAPGPFRLSVTFDRPMMPGSYSFVQRSAESYPQCSPRAAISPDHRTYSVRCTALPGRRFEVWFNSPPYMNFKSVSEVPAQPYQLLFRTRGR